MAIIAMRARDPLDPALLTEIYIDESSQTKNRFLVMGGIGIEGTATAGALDHLAQVRLPQLPHGEMKWGKVSTAKLPAYGRTVKAFFDHPSLSTAHFHCLVVDTHALNHGRLCTLQHQGRALSRAAMPGFLDLGLPALLRRVGA